MVQVYRLGINQVGGQDNWAMDKDLVQIHKHTRNAQGHIQPPNKPGQYRIYYMA